MKVLWICSTPSLGAAALGSPLSLVGGWVAALEEAIRRRGEIELDVAFPWDEPVGRRIVDGRHAYLPFPRYPRGGRLRRLLFDASCRLAPETEVDHLLRVVELSRPDLVHVWGTEAFYGLVIERCELPVLVEIQGPRNPYAEVYCEGLTRLDLLRFGSPKRLLNGRSLLHTYYRYRRSAERERRILAAARFVSGRTGWDRLVTTALAPEARYFHADRVLRAPFYGAEWRRRAGDGELRLISTLRGNAYKGIETLARCAELLRRRLGGGLRWTVVGVRPNEEIHRIVEHKLGLSFERLGIHLPGRLSAEEVVGRLLQADLFVLPSRIENSPNGLCEAMLVGLPIVSTNVGGIPSLVEDESEALLVPAGDPWSMAGAILRLAGDAGLGDRLAAAARRRARRRHDPAAVAEGVIGLYREIVADAGGAASRQAAR